MEHPLNITMLNDFIFCPMSIYFHALDSETERLLLQRDSQLNGTNAHFTVDNQLYSDRLDILQGIVVFSDEYNLLGKIDIFDISKSELVERKNKIKVIYDGYIFQLYAQYFALCEMGYDVNKIKLYSKQDNKMYDIKLPHEDIEMLGKFKKLLCEIANFSINEFEQNNKQKCNNCIYEELCCYSAIKEDE